MPQLLLIFSVLLFRASVTWYFTVFTLTLFCVTVQYGAFYFLNILSSAKISWHKTTAHAYNVTRFGLLKSGITLFLLGILYPKTNYNRFNEFIFPITCVVLFITPYLTDALKIHTYHKSVLNTVIGFITFPFLVWYGIIPSMHFIHSTLLPWQVFVSTITAGIALLIVIRLSSKQIVFTCKEKSYLSSFLFAFTALRLYLFYVHDLLIWYTNLPHASFFLLNRNNEYHELFLLSLLLNYAIPLTLLFSSTWKQKHKLLFLSAISVLLGFLFDVFSYIHPISPQAGFITCILCTASLPVFLGIHFYQIKSNLKYKALLVIPFLIILNACSNSETNTERTYEYFPDMQHSTAYQTYTKQTAMKTTVEGTVNRTYAPTLLQKNRADRLQAATFYNLPTHIDASVINLGKQMYEFNCVVCHGVTGDGKGEFFTSRKFMYPPANLLDTTVITTPNAELYHVITVGFNLMASHASILNETERFATVCYIRHLQSGLNQTSKPLPH